MMKKSIDKNKNKTDKARRTLLKKAIYAAPTIVVLGALMKPKQAKADFGPPPSDPDGDDGGW